MVFTIFCPNYVAYSAGARVLWRLGNLLGVLGHKVYYINYQANSQPAPAWSTMEPAPGNATQGTVIAPETFPELPIPHVRWALNKPGLIGGPANYQKDVQVFYYCDLFEESAKAASHNGISRELLIGSIDPPKPTPTSPKPLWLWYRGKYTGPVKLNSHHNQIELTRHWPPTKQQYWELLNQSHTLSSYDDCSGTNFEAYLWGLQVEVWDGEKFISFKPPTYIHDLIIDEDKDLVRVQAFVEALQCS